MLEHVIITVSLMAITGMGCYYLGHRTLEGVKTDLHNKEIEFAALKAKLSAKTK